MSAFNVPERITTALSGIINLFFVVAESDNTPYAVYDIKSNPIKNKDGIYKYICTVTIAVVGSSFDEVDNIANLLENAMEGLISSDLMVIQNSRQPVSDDEQQWIVYFEYNITQLI